MIAWASSSNWIEHRIPDPGVVGSIPTLPAKCAGGPTAEAQNLRFWG